MEIREAVAEDYDSLVELYQQFLGKDKIIGNDSDNSFSEVMADPNAHIWVMQTDKKLVGFMSFSNRFVFRYSKPIVQVEELYITEQNRRKGLAKRFLIRLEEWSREQNVHAIYIESRHDLTSAHVFYETSNYFRDGYYFKKMI